MSPLDELVRQIAAVAAEQVAARVLAELPGIVRAELDSRDTDRWINQAQLAALLGCSGKALSMRLARPAGAALLALAVESPGGRGRLWRKRDVGALLARRGGR